MVSRHRRDPPCPRVHEASLGGPVRSDRGGWGRVFPAVREASWGHRMTRLAEVAAACRQRGRRGCLRFRGCLLPPPRYRQECRARSSRPRRGHRPATSPRPDRRGATHEWRAPHPWPPGGSGDAVAGLQTALSDPLVRPAPSSERSAGPRTSPCRQKTLGRWPRCPQWQLRKRPCIPSRRASGLPSRILLVRRTLAIPRRSPRQDGFWHEQDQGSETPVRHCHGRRAGPFASRWLSAASTLPAVRVPPCRNQRTTAPELWPIRDSLAG